MAKTLGIAEETPKTDDSPARDGKRRGKCTNNRGTGRGDLGELAIEEVRIEIMGSKRRASLDTGARARCES